MKNTIFVVAFIVSLLIAVRGIYLFFKKRRKESFIYLLVSIFLFLLSGLTAPSIVLNLENVKITTNSDGEAVIKGMTAPNGMVEIDGEEIELNQQGEFTYKVTLEKAKEKKVSVKGIVKRKKQEEVVIVQPSKEFIKKEKNR